MVACKIGPDQFIAKIAKEPTKGAAKRKRPKGDDSETPYLHVLTLNCSRRMSRAGIIAFAMRDIRAPLSPGSAASGDTAERLGEGID